MEATGVIDAPPSVDWDVLVTGEDYAAWNPFITDVSGELVAGARPRLHIASPGKRGMTFRPRVLDATPEARLRWVGRLGLPGLCDGQHEFLLAATDSGGTQVTPRETFRGALVPLLEGRLEPARQGFNEMHTTLRERAEARANRR
jgi:hypothetical protein